MTSLEKQTVNRSYQTTMNDVRSELGPLERAWSKVIHAQVLSQVGSFLSATILRPRPLLTAVIIAATFVVAAYLLERLYNYQVSGFESLLGFSIGWLAGAIYGLTSRLAKQLIIK